MLIHVANSDELTQKHFLLQLLKKKSYLEKQFKPKLHIFDSSDLNLESAEGGKKCAN